ncbi:MAG: hypothetical protein C7B46_04775 [Sulfobacillus benefaciens]|uniref:NmrA-like domain-containing protein n=1 Tax=Sulfobacillus benefaciens TaxID=453960 RepID=A0A2T2XIW5_9FIRM|nr:MAG: hypothetical protein C7B46_04775 [Sulfobacillus benefaciens]
MASAPSDSGTGVVTPQKGPILVIGATENQGGHVAKALLDEGWTVHALTRNAESPKAQALKSQGAHLVTGDMADLPALTKAITAVTGIFSVQNFWDLGLKEEVRLGSHVIQAAINAGNHPQIIYSSGLGAEQRQNVAAIDGKALLEEKLRHSGLPFTILRPGLFMDDFLGASLPFARPIQNLLDGHRPLVGRLFLATLRAVMPQNSRIPLTTLQDVGRMAAWAFGNPKESQRQVFEVIGSSETAELLCALWMEVTGQPIPRIPGLRLGIRMGHPKMLALLSWLGQCETPATSTPIVLSTFREWLNSTCAQR